MIVSLNSKVIKWCKIKNIHDLLLRERDKMNQHSLLSFNQNIGCSFWPGEKSAGKRVLKSRDILKSPGCFVSGRSLCTRSLASLSSFMANSARMCRWILFQTLLGSPRFARLLLDPTWRLDEPGSCSVELPTLHVQYFPGFKGSNCWRILKKYHQSELCSVLF